jgi:phosphoribosyl 1,2-cyclic phosphodiesterase
MRVRFFGVRGSTPSPGPEFTRYGGHTSCVAVYQDGASTPALVLDAGTGIRALSASLAGRPFRGTILLSHLHWDHVQGLPFFAAAATPGSTTCVMVPAPPDSDPVDLLRPMIGPPFFPLAPDELRGEWGYDAIPTTPFTVGPFTVTPLELPHIGLTIGFRVTDGRATLAYVTDRGPEDDPEPNAIELATGADLLIHDAQHTRAEFEAKRFLGHSTPDHALELAGAAGAKRVALFHHDFDRTDAEIDAIVGVLDQTIPVFAAAEGQFVDL